MIDETVLVLGDLFFPAGSGRGITQSLDPIDNGDLRRTVNGDLVDTTRSANRKYESSIRCDDMDSPSLAGIWRGQELEVECITFINQLVSPAATTATLVRPAVEASIVGFKADGTRIAPTDYDDGTDLVTFAESVASVKFRPILQMMVADFSIEEDEWGSETGWSIDLEEV